MGKAVQTVNTDVVVTDEELGMFGTDEGDNTDILIPKVLLMQGQSQMVMDGDASFGEYRHSLTKEKLGDVKTPLKILPFYMYKQWLVSKKNGERWEFHSIEQHQKGVIHEYTEQINGEWYKFEETLCFYCMLKDIPLPVVVAFKSTSKKAGKNMYTQMYVINKSIKKLPFSYWFDLKSVKESKNNNTFAVMDVVKGAEATAEEVENCKTWWKIVGEQNVKVDNTDHDYDASPSVQTEVEINANDTRF